MYKIGSNSYSLKPQTILFGEFVTQLIPQATECGQMNQKMTAIKLD